MRFILSAIFLASLATAQQAPLQLSLKRALDLALAPDGNTQVQLAVESLRQSETRVTQERSAFFPDLSGFVTYQDQTRNLAAFGISFNVPIPGFQFPTLVGPFTTFEARARVQQNVLDLSTVRRYQASRAGLAATRSESDATSEQVAAQVARAYLSALKTQADVDTVKANIALDEAVLKQVTNQKAAGTGTGIEITRARVQLSNEQQRLLVAENERRRTRLQLLRSIGLPLDTDLQFIDKLEYTPVDALTLDQAKTKAMESRPDLATQQQREETSRLSASAINMEHVPSVSAFADYGNVGTGFNDHALPTYTYGVTLRVPIFDGGRREARHAESVSKYRSEQTRTRDLRRQVELDVQLALDSLRSAEEQVKVARDGLVLADAELTQARRRYDAGVTNSLEVTDAQTRLERARDNQTAALFNYNVARIDLAQAMGAVRRTIQ